MGTVVSHCLFHFAQPCFKSAADPHGLNHSKSHFGPSNIKVTDPLDIQPMINLASFVSGVNL